MAETTTLEQFRERLAAGHRVIPVLRERFADAETPIGIYRKLAAGRPGTFLLESAEQGGVWGRWSFVGVGAFPALSAASTLDDLDALYRAWETPRVDGHPPLTGGLVGFIGWDAVRQLEHLPNRPPVEHPLPGQAFSFVAELLAIDHRFGTVTLIANVLADDATEPELLWAGAQRRLDALETGLAAPGDPDVAAIDMSTPPAYRARGTQAQFEAAVRRSKEYVRDGDVFQVVISQRFDADCEADPLDVYRVLRALNPSPYMALLAFEDEQGMPYFIVGSSPEALVKVTDGRITTHPIAGSRPRGATPEEDAALADELLIDPKERAEHLMLVDLARNDVSKVSNPGSVEVTEFMVIERFSHIMHIVSTVEGDLRAGATPIDVFRATFPAGTLSGAPKPRALEIIDELEPVARGVYGGVFGYFDLAGDADLAIAIRTAVIRDGIATVQAGAGLVADSDPATEHQESINKAAAPLRAIAIANALRR